MTFAMNNPELTVRPLRAQLQAHRVDATAQVLWRVRQAFALVTAAFAPFGCEDVDDLTIRAVGVENGPGTTDDTAYDLPIEYKTWLDEASGHVIFQMDRKLYRAPVQRDEPLQELEGLLDGISPGSDSSASVSPDGKWMVMQSTRELCREPAAQAPDEEPWECLATAQFGDRTQVLQDGKSKREPGKFGVASMQPVRIAGKLRLRDAALPVVSNAGTLIVFQATSGSASMGVRFPGPENQTHLYAITRTPRSNTWSEPRALTLGSPFPFHSFAALSPDGRTVVMDCHRELDIVLPRSICAVNVDGSGFREVVRPEDGRVDGRPPGMGGANHHATYAPDGTIVFESDWSVQTDVGWGPCEAIWRFESNSRSLVRVSPEQCNDNTPCVLPDGRIASLWLPRKGHEVKVFDPLTATFFMLTPGRDVTDFTLSCSL
ncbi:MAG: hypothetical protein MUF54_07120 [Polyangiaceae bacterium]|jgi:hypothetical protein|nr:hypothetical protein [Polyangiaceae bacterium]